MSEALRIKGAVAKLETTVRGEVVDSKYVFVPECDWYSKFAKDIVAEIEIFAPIMEIFGTEVAKRVMEGEIVPVTLVVSGKMAEDLELVECPKKVEFYRKTFKIIYPYHGLAQSLHKRKL